MEERNGWFEWAEPIIEKLGLQFLCDSPSILTVSHCDYNATYQSAARQGFKFFAQFSVTFIGDLNSSVTLRVTKD